MNVTAGSCASGGSKEGQFRVEVERSRWFWVFLACDIGSQETWGLSGGKEDPAVIGCRWFRDLQGWLRQHRKLDVCTKGQNSEHTPQKNKQAGSWECPYSWREWHGNPEAQMHTLISRTPKVVSEHRLSEDCTSLDTRAQDRVAGSIDSALLTPS